MNSKYLHGIMSNRRNVVTFILVEGALVEGVGNVCNAIFFLIVRLISRLVMFRDLVWIIFSSVP